MHRLKLTFAVMLAAIFFCVGCASKNETNAGGISPEKFSDEAPQLPRQELIVYSSPEKYSYEDLMHDINILRERYPSQIRVDKLCDTLDGRGVYDIVLGNGDKQILIFGAMHAREYITAQVVMRQLCESLDAINGGGSYRSISVAELLQGLTIHFVPNSNPDGVAISQFGLSALKNDSVRNRVAAMNDGGDLEQWKANANGVDLNRNFDADWADFYGSPAPAPDRYKGTSPGSEPEAAALIRLTRDCHIKRAISYHTCGAVIYWYYKQSGQVLDESKKFAADISAATNYYLDDDYTALDPAGYKDWAVYKLGIPSITIEVGGENGNIVNPVPQGRFNAIWERNKNVVYATAYNLKY